MARPHHNFLIILSSKFSGFWRLYLVTCSPSFTENWRIREKSLCYLRIVYKLNSNLLHKYIFLINAYFTLIYDKETWLQIKILRAVLILFSNFQNKHNASKVMLFNLFRLEGLVTIVILKYISRITIFNTWLLFGVLQCLQVYIGSSLGNGYRLYFRVTYNLRHMLKLYIFKRFQLLFPWMG